MIKELKFNNGNTALIERGEGKCDYQTFITIGSRRFTLNNSAAFALALAIMDLEGESEAETYRCERCKKTFNSHKESSYHSSYYKDHGDWCMECREEMIEERSAKLLAENQARIEARRLERAEASA